MITKENKYNYFYNVPECFNKRKITYTFDTYLYSEDFKGEVVTFTQGHDSYTGKVIDQFNKDDRTHFVLDHCDKIPDKMKTVKDLTNE